MALVRFTQETPQQTGSQQCAGLSTEQGIQVYTRLYATTKGIQQPDSSQELNLDSAQQPRVMRG